MFCSTGCYYGHLAVGQAKLLLAREPIDQLLANPETDPELREKLELVEQARAFAAELGLEVDGQYTSYVPWPGDRIVTSVIATRAGEIRPSNFRFPIVGDVPYKGFFDPELAKEEAEDLRAKGMDVCVSAIRAYSTLGWFDDPLTAPMLDASDARVVETVVHELVHATVFVNSQPDFNEGAANFIGEEAAVLFFATAGKAVDATEQSVRARIDDDRKIAAAFMSLRADVEALYALELDPAEREQRRTELEVAGREHLAGLDLGSRSATQLSKVARINDACLAIQGTYVSDTPSYREVYERLEGDLVEFISRLRDAASASDPRETFFAP